MSRGGKRIGAGRRPGQVNIKTKQAQDIALKVLQRSIDSEEKWRELLNCSNPGIQA